MGERKVTVIQGHPLADSFCAALTGAYVTGAREAGAEVREHSTAQMEFDPVLHRAYRDIQQLEPDLLALWDDILWAEHLVFAYPVWWGTPPAEMKGVFDRLFLPGFAFKYATERSVFQEKKLKGRTGRLICTMDSPPLYYRWIVGGAGVKMMRNSILKFAGVTPVRASLFGSVKLSSAEKRATWLRRAESRGRGDAK